MFSVSSLRALTAGCLTLGLALAATPAGAAMMSHSYALHGSGQFGKAMASATVTQVSRGDFKVAIVAEHLPNPTMLHVKPTRHVYVAWLLNGMAKRHTMMGVAHLALMYDRKTGNYTGHGVVMTDTVTGIIITAEPGGLSHAPAMPEVTALTTMGHGQM